MITTLNAAVSELRFFAGAAPNANAESTQKLLWRIKRFRSMLLTNPKEGSATLPSKPIRVLSIEDHPIFSVGLSKLLASQPDMLLVGQADNAAAGLTEFRRVRPDITLMDLRLPGMSGTDALLAIRREFPNARVIVLTSVDTDGEIQRALRAGASGYILKNMAGQDILAVIRSVYHGEHRRLPSEVAVRIAEHFGQEDLTDRELQVLKLIRDGNRTKQIADRLAISESTVNFHLQNLVEKLGANDRSHALAIAIRRGLLEP